MTATISRLLSQTRHTSVHGPASGRRSLGRQVSAFVYAIYLALVAVASGCTSLISPISGVPAHRLPPEFLAQPRNNLVPIDFSRLRQEPPREYLLDKGDVLGIYIEGVLGDLNQLPPVHFPEPGSELPPAIGYPVPVREDGTIALPLVPPIPVRGLTLNQAQDAIRKAYTIDQEILRPGKDRIIVTLMRERTYSIIVIRQDGVDASTLGPVSARGGGGFGRGGGFAARSSQLSRGQVIQLPAYKNDVLHALATTGGLPGVNAKNEVKILRSSLLDAQKRDAFVQQFYLQHGDQGPCLCAPPLPDDPSIIRIPLRLPPGEVPRFRPEDIILEDGDIVLIESRETEVFYTGGLLGPGEYPLPRDYDLDALTALSVVGPGVGNPFGGFGGTGGGIGANLGTALGGAPPGQLYILRKTPCNGQVIIAVDMNRAIRDPRARPLIQPGDVLILRYKPEEEVLNFGIGTFFLHGFFQFFRRN